MNKRVVALLLLLVFVIFPFYCLDIEMDGVGSSFEEAREDARSNLAQYINGVFVQSSTMSSSYDDSVSSSDVLSSSTNTTSNGYLKSVEYINEYKDGTEYYSTAIIKDNNVNTTAIRSSLKTDKATIETLYRNLPNQNSQQKKNTLITIYSVLTEYDAYKTILIYMGHSDLVPELDINVTTTSIFIEYQNIVIEEGYALEEREKYITDETEHQKLLEELAANRSEQRKIEKEKNEAAAAREEASRSALAERLKQYEAVTHSQAKITATTGKERYEMLRGEILSSRENFLNSCAEYDNLCKEQFALIDKDFEAEKAAVKARPYRYAELNGSEPTVAAKQVRNDEIDYLYIHKELYKAEVFKQIRASLLTPIRDRYTLYCESIAAIDGENFEMTLGDDTIEKVATSFDAIDVTWTISVQLKNIVGLDSQILKFVLSYKDLTGDSTKEPKYRGQQGYDEYMLYLDNIDYLDTVIKAFIDSFRITLDFKVCADKEDVGIGYSGLTFSNMMLELESNALNTDSTWNYVVPFSTSVSDECLSWTLPGYAKTFDFEFLTTQK